MGPSPHQATPSLPKTGTHISCPLQPAKSHFSYAQDEVIIRLREVLPNGVLVTILADRGFGDQKLYAMLQEFGFKFVIRFRENIQVSSSAGEARPAAEWVPSNGRARMLRDAAVTADQAKVPTVVLVKAAGMKEAWCLATNHAGLGARYIVDLYARRFTIEENFRDTKDIRFGFGLSATHISTPERRDRLLLVGALGQALATLLGAAGESLGMDRMLKANTVKHRTHSLFRQKLHYYRAIPAMPEHRLTSLMQRFGEMVTAQQLCVAIFGIL